MTKTAGELGGPERVVLSAQCAHLDAECDIRAATEEQVPDLAVAGDGDLAAEFPSTSDAADESPTRRVHRFGGLDGPQGLGG
jgi:hypothetical protein